MTGRGTITRKPKQGLHLLLAAQVFWLGAVFALGGWWGSLVLKQASKIAELELASGLAASEAHAQWLKTQHMLFWESASYFVLLVASTGVLFWLYWRDARRTRSLQAFFASLTHELRTPLTSIRLQAESIADSLPPEADQKDLVQRLLEDTQRLELQVERVLELARVEGGGPIFTQAIQVKPWLERIVNDWQAHRDEKVEISLELQDIQILADQVAMQVILKNLLENAVRHSHQNALKIRIASQVTSEGVFLVFRDNGRGFQGNTRYLGKIFEKGPSSPGAGVGLYLVQILMKRMGGFARFTSPDQGADNGFEVSLFFAKGARS
jgi:signal transduction histidine kinase